MRRLRRLSHRWPWLAAGIFLGGPMAWGVAYSLAYSLGGIGLLSDGWTVRHWANAFRVGGLRDSLLFSPLIAAIVTGLATSGALGVVLAAPQLRRSRVMAAICCLPLATPAAVLAMMTYQVLNPGGYLARVAYHLGWMNSPSDFPPLVHDPYAVGQVVAQVSAAWPLLVLFFLRTWTAAHVDRYCRLAESLGASPLEARWRIAAPMLLQRGRPLILLTFLWALGSYEIPLILGRQSPQMVSVLIRRRFGQFDIHDRPEAFALASLYFLAAGAGTWLLLSWRRRHG